MKKRTTVTAEADDLEILRAEARRLGIPLSDLLKVAVAEKAAEIQAERRPRLGVGRSGTDDLSTVSAEDEDSPAATSYRS